ncbi:TIGR01906 family membrane protein [Clostridium sp.]|uniref:TIGR01906 family membrane protein n=1 Tax=Clostridium sp. TaxID=1506 RepID=UPI002FC9076B
MYLLDYVSEIKNNNHRKYKLFQSLFALFFSLLIISLAVKITLLFKPLYYFDIEYLNIEKLSGFTKEEIIKNYNYVINYLLIPKAQPFNLPSITYSQVGQIHFKEVKNVFISFDILLVISLIITSIGVWASSKLKDFDLLKKTSKTLLVLPLVLMVAFVVNFDVSFVIFHKIFFPNGNWQFDPEFDPIINILPQEFFFHSAVFILILIIISSLVLALVYKKISSKNYSNK